MLHERRACVRRGRFWIRGGSALLSTGTARLMVDGCKLADEDDRPACAPNALDELCSIFGAGMDSQGGVAGFALRSRREVQR